MIMQATITCFVLFVLLSNIYAQFSPDNGQILVNNPDPSEHLVRSGGETAAANEQTMLKHIGKVTYKSPASRPIDQKRSRRQKREQPDSCTKSLYDDFY
ncbi:unnamed protein product [Adineta steineri]|uniref:Secreted protein n=1 Tax=Adineta steineri TaxID=433720 RepID=A0A814L2H4_9BILA|nr:unnamed protein product [Adineta steineri]CAF1125281.1 unnamed protein product [Adineta steineri]